MLQLFKYSVSQLWEQEPSHVTVLRLLDAARATYNAQQFSQPKVTTPYSLGRLADIISGFSTSVRWASPEYNHNAHVVVVTHELAEYWRQDQSIRLYLDFVYKRSLTELGAVGVLYGARVLTDEMLPFLQRDLGANLIQMYFTATGEHHSIPHNLVF